MSYLNLRIEEKWIRCTNFHFIIEVWKWPLEQKFWKKNYTTLISIKNTTNFALTTFLYNHFFGRAPDHGQFPQTRGEHHF